MNEVVYKIADVIFKTNHIYNYTPQQLKNYIYNGKDKIAVEFLITDFDIQKEREFAEDIENFSDAYLESLALFRKLGNYMLNYADGIIFHSSAVAVDGQAYLFTAPSGTGKSTHARLWKEMLDERLVYINDDKPIIRFVEGEFYAYGTPWNGKHALDNNMRAKIKAICRINQGVENKIKEISPQEMLFVILRQTIRPENEKEADKLFILIDRLLKSVKCYSLDCNISRQAAELSFGVMSEI